MEKESISESKESCDILNMISSDASAKNLTKNSISNASNISTLDLAVVGNSCCSALIDKKGSIVWYCLPRFDGDPIFCNLLKTNMNDNGFFDVKMPNLAYTEQSYISNSAVVCTKLFDKNNECLEIVDFIPRFQSHDREYRPTMLIRILKPLKGRPRVQVRLRPTFGYGWGSPEKTRGSNHIRYVLSNSTLRLTSNAPIAYLLDEVLFDVEETIFLILMPDESLRSPIEEICYSNLHKTLKFWREWTKHLTLPFEYQDETIRQAIGLKLLAFEETGGIVSSLTTSIPHYWETIVGKSSSSITFKSNLGTSDARYCWLRDSFWLINGLNQVGITLTMENYLRFLCNVLTAYCQKIEQQQDQQQSQLSSSQGSLGSVGSVGSHGSHLHLNSNIPPNFAASLSQLSHISGIASTPPSPLVSKLRMNRKEIQAVYTVSLESRIYEREVHRLPGFRGIGPVKLGTRDCDAIQHEVYGSIVLSLSQMFFDKRLEFQGHKSLFEKMEKLGEAAANLYDKPDHGPRSCFNDEGDVDSRKEDDPVCGRLQVHTFSAVMCWAACDRLSKISSVLGLADRKIFWEKTAQKMQKNIFLRAWNSKLETFTSTFKGESVDAYVLTFPRLGFIDALDPKFLKTLKFVEKKLGVSSNSANFQEKKNEKNNSFQEKNDEKTDKIFPEQKNLEEHVKKLQIFEKNEGNFQEKSTKKTIPSIVTTIEEKKNENNENFQEKNNEKNNYFQEKADEKTENEEKEKGFEEGKKSEKNENFQEKKNEKNFSSSSSTSSSPFFQKDSTSASNSPFPTSDLLRSPPKSPKSPNFPKIEYIRCYESDEFALFGATLEYFGVLIEVGRKKEARDLFEKFLKKSNRCGLFSEAVNWKTGEMTGNFPSSNVMVGVIWVASKLSKPWTRAF